MESLSLRCELMAGLFLCCLVMDKLLPQFCFVLGVDAIEELGGLQLHEDGSLLFGLAAASGNALEIEDTDFSAVFDGSTWTVKWKWKWVSGEPHHLWVGGSTSGCFLLVT